MAQEEIKEQEEPRKQVEIVTLSTGETLNKWCMSHFDDLTLNQEVIWDILDITSKLTHLNIIKNKEGFITDVSLVLPKITEEVVLFALKNFMEHQKLREESVSAESVMELRRLKLQKHIEEINK
jgi:hypothetical protein